VSVGWKTGLVACRGPLRPRRLALGVMLGPFTVEILGFGVAEYNELATRNLGGFEAEVGAFSPASRE
jgi:hypothetical protein